MTFWILTTLMILSAMAYICSPMLRATVSSRDEVDSEQTLYKARIAEIEKDTELGRLDEVSAQAAKLEEARRLIKSSENSKQLSHTSSNKILILAAAICLPLISLPLYNKLGSPNVIQPEQVAQEPAQQMTLDQLLEVAERRLADNPDDTNGWKALAPVYVRQERYTDAINAYENILRIEGRKPEFILKLADVYIEQTKGQIDERAKTLIAEVLSLENNNPIATFYTGIIALQNDDEVETKRIWQGMLDGANGDEEWIPVITGRLAELETLQFSNKLPPVPKEVLESADDMTPQQRAEMINQMVSNLKEKLEDDPTDKRGWERLITAYMVLDRQADAFAAFEKASNQFADDKSFIASLKQRTMNKTNEGGNQ